MADQDLAPADLGDLVGRGHRDVDDDVGAPGIADLGACLGVGVVGVAGLDARAGLDDHGDLLVGKRLDDIGDQRHAALALSRLFRNPDLQSAQEPIQLWPMLAGYPSERLIPLSAHPDSSRSRPNASTGPRAPAPACAASPFGGRLGRPSEEQAGELVAG